MRILVISNLFPPFVVGGYEINCRNVTNELEARGHVVRILTSAGHQKGLSFDDSVKRCLALHSAFTPQYPEAVDQQQTLYLGDCSNYFNIHALVGELTAFQPDIVFLWNIHGLGGLHIIDTLNLLEIPWAIYLGDRVFEQITRPFPPHVRSIFRGNDPNYFAKGLVFSVSQTLTDEIENLANFRFPNNPVHVYGYVFPNKRKRAHAAYQKNNFTRFAYAGRIGDHKGVGIICDAVDWLLRRGSKEFRVDLYGEGEVTSYVAYVRSLQLDGNVFFHGGVSQDKLAEAYSQSDAFLFPTWEREPFAFAPFEAAAFGCAPILTANCGCAERLVDGVHCVKVERNASALGEAMLKVMNKQIDAASMGALAAQLVNTDLTFERHVDLIEAGLATKKIDGPRSGAIPSDFLARQFLKHHLGLALLHNRID